MQRGTHGLVTISATLGWPFFASVQAFGVDPLAKNRAFLLVPDLTMTPPGADSIVWQWGYGERAQYTFDKKGVYTQLCNVHPEMESFIVALDTPYFVLTDKDGNFELQGVPSGNYTVKVWHEKLRFKKQQISVSEKGVDNVVFKRKKRK